MSFKLSSKCLACVVSIAVVFNSFSSAAFASESTGPKKEKSRSVAPSFSGSLAVTSGNAAHELVRQCALPGANVTEISNQLFRLFITNPAFGAEREKDGLTPLDLALTLGCPVEVESLCYAYRYPFDGTHSVKERKQYWSYIRDLLPRVPSECLIGFLNKFDNENDMAQVMVSKLEATARVFSLVCFKGDIDKVYYDGNGWKFYYHALFEDFEMAKIFFERSCSTYFSFGRRTNAADHKFDSPILKDPSLVVWAPLLAFILIGDAGATKECLNMITPYVDMKNHRWRYPLWVLIKGVLAGGMMSEDMKLILTTHPLTKDVCKFLK